MKRVISLSLGSSKRDKTVTAEFFGETFEISRLGVDGDEKKFVERLAELDGTVDAIGYGGMDRYLWSEGKRYETASVDVEDLRLAGELSPTPDGFVVGFRAAQSFYLEGNIRQSSYSYNYGTLGFQLSYQVVAILRTRENAPLYVVRDSVIVPHTRERSEQYGGSVYAAASGRIDLPENGSPVLRRVTMKADAIGYTTGIFCDTRSSAGVAIPTQAGDFIVGTSLWDTTVNYRGRETRTVRHSFAERTSDPSIEVRVSGSDVLMGDTIEVEFAGQGRRRRDKS